MFDKLYIQDGGGLGDTIRYYLLGYRGWHWIKPLKIKYPNLKLKVILITHNSQAAEFLRYNPYIDTIKSFPFYSWRRYTPEFFKKEIEGYTWIEDPKVQIMTNTVKLEKLRVYTTAEDELVIEEIQSQGRYIFLHPFSTSKTRQGLPPKEYFILVDRLIDKGYKVVVVGGTMNYKGYYLNDTSCSPFSRAVKESFSYNRKGLFNLVNKTNSRVCTKLIQGASGFIGGYSAYIPVAWVLKIPSVVSANICYQEHMTSAKRVMWNEAYKNDIGKEIGVDPKEKNYDKIRDQILSCFK